MSERRPPQTLEEAYWLRDEASDLELRDFYQDQVYRLRGKEYCQRGIRTELSSERRERQRSIEFSRETFFLEVDEISGRQGGNDAHSLHQEGRLYAGRLDAHACLKQLASPHPGVVDSAVEAYRRNFLELLRVGKPPKEAYYLSRIIGSVGDEEFRGALEGIQQSGHPKSKMACNMERAAIQVRDLPGGMVAILLTFFASLVAFVWLTNYFSKADTSIIIFVALGVIAAGTLMLTCVLLIVTCIRSFNK